MARRCLRLLALCVLLAGCASEPPKHRVLRAILEAYVAGVDAVVAANPLAPGEEVKAVEVGRDETMSVHVVQVRAGGSIQPHHHAYHEETVQIIRGFGTMTIGTESSIVGPGSSFIIPVGARHTFRNTGAETAVAVVGYTPAFDGSDRIADK